MAATKTHVITYVRGTTYSITSNYTGPALGSTLKFTVKIVANDSDSSDTANAVLSPKSVAMSGSTFPQTTTITIAPTDVSLSKLPGNYFYSLKVIDSLGHEYVADSGQFVLQAITTNETS